MRAFIELYIDMNILISILLIIL